MKLKFDTYGQSPGRSGERAREKEILKIKNQNAKLRRLTSVFAKATTQQVGGGNYKKEYRRQEKMNIERLTSNVEWYKS